VNLVKFGKHFKSLRSPLWCSIPNSKPSDSVQKEEQYFCPHLFYYSVKQKYTSIGMLREVSFCIKKFYPTFNLKLREGLQ